MSKGILDKTIGALNTTLNLRSMNQNVISSNIANADTPGYKAQKMEFEQALRDQLGVDSDLTLEGEHHDHFVPDSTAAIEPEIYDVPNDVHSLDGNSVDRAAEMSRMAENQIMYDTSIELLRKKIGLLRYAVTDGGSK